MRKLLMAISLAVFLGCSTAQKTAQTPSVSETGVSGSQGGPTVDYVGLQRSLGMETPLEQLGYKERIFNTCQVGYGYSSTHNCRHEFMTVINIRLQCRDSEGTVSQGVMNADLTAISNRPVRWNLKNNKGLTQTDSEGFAQILTVAPRSLKRERLKIGVGNDFLYMRANEITRVVTPRPWCHP